MMHRKRTTLRKSNELVLATLISCLMGCNLSSNTELVTKSSKFIEDNKLYLNEIARVLDDSIVQKHRYIRIYQGSANSVWHFKFDSLFHPKDTVPIDPVRVKSWNMRKLLVGVEFDISENKVIYEVAGINNKNDRSVALHFYKAPVALAKHPSCYSMQEDSNAFNSLDNFKCALDSHWVVVSRPDW